MYCPDAKLNIPIYLDEAIIAFIEYIANKKGIDCSSVANKLLRGSIRGQKAEDRLLSASHSESPLAWSILLSKMKSHQIN